MTDRKLMQQLLDCIIWSTEYRLGVPAYKKAEAILIARLAQPEPEPFGYLWPTDSYPEFRYFKKMKNGIPGTPIYTAPPQRNEPEPVAWWDEKFDVAYSLSEITDTQRKHHYRPLYTAPPQRNEWQELSDYDVDNIVDL